MEIDVEQPRLEPVHAERQSQIGRDRALADPAFPGKHEEDVPDVAEV